MATAFWPGSLNSNESHYCFGGARLCFSDVCVVGQGAVQVQISFKGTAYQTNTTGNIVATPITDQTLLQDRAAMGGITDLSTLAIVYHIAGDEKGDTVEIVNSSNGQKLAFEFGFWFGDDPTLGRSSLTNATKTEVRRVDYIYTLENSTYTFLNSHSMGAAFVTKRFVTDTGGNVRPTIEGTMQWTVNPQSNRSTIVCVGSFTLGQLLF